MQTDKAIAALVERLESVTKRLESIEGKIGAGGGGGGGGSAGGASAGGDSDATSVVEFETLVREHISKFTAASAKLGGETAEIAPLFAGAVDALRNVLVGATAAKKPDAAGMAAFVKPLADAIQAVVEYRNAHRGSKEWDHLSTVSEGVAAFGWVCVEPTPGPFAVQVNGLNKQQRCSSFSLSTQTRAGSEFYSNKLLRLYKDKDETQMAWISSFNGFLKGMEGYIKDYHVGWRVHPFACSPAPHALSAPACNSAAPAKPRRLLPLRRPRVPVVRHRPCRKSVSFFCGVSGFCFVSHVAFVQGPLVSKEELSGKGPASRGGGDRGGLFAELNQGGKITSGLKKVTRDMQTHKNKELRAGGVVKATAAKKVAKHRGIPTGTPKGPVLEGNKWVLEFVVDGGTIDIEPDIKHSLYIYGCVNTVVNVKSKVNQVQMDSCKKVSFVGTDVLATVDVVNCNVSDSAARRDWPAAQRAVCLTELPSASAGQESDDRCRKDVWHERVPIQGRSGVRDHHGQVRQCQCGHSGRRRRVCRVSHSGAVQVGGQRRQDRHGRSRARRYGKASCGAQKKKKKKSSETDAKKTSFRLSAKQQLFVVRAIKR